jgi:alanine racemase
MHVVLDAAGGHPVVGDEFTVFGAGGSSATDLAEAIGTVGEEIVLRISPLVPRVYLGD